MAVNAYRIGVHLAMTNGVSGALAQISSQMLGLHGHIKAAQLGFNSLSTAIAGAAATFAGAGLIKGMAALVQHGAELVHQQTLLKAAGEDNAAVARATSRAWETAFQVQGTGVAANMRVLGDLRGLFGSLGEAEQVLPQFAQFQRVLGAVTGKQDEKAGGVMAQALDLMGAVQFDPKTGALLADRFNTYMNQAMAAVIQNRGRVGPEQIRNFVQQAGPAAIAMSPQQLFADMAPLIESMGGLRAGTGITAMQRQYQNGIMTDRTLDTLRMLGMVTGPAGKITARERTAAAAAMQREMEGGAQIDPASLVKVAPKGIRGAERLATGDYVGFVLDVLVPQVERFLQKTGQEITQQSIVALLTRAGGTSTGQRTAAQIYLSQQQIERERALQAQVARDPAAAVQKIQNEDPKAAWARLTESWNNLLTAFGAPTVPTAVRLMNMLASGIDKVTQVVVAHPGAARALVGIAVGLGAALVVIGGLAVAAAAITAIGGGGVAAVIVGIITALGGLGALLLTMDWRTMLGDLRSSFAQAAAYLGQLPGKAWTAIVSGYNAAVAYAQGVVGRARADLSSTFGQIGTFLTGWAAEVAARISGWRDAVTAAVGSFRDAAAAAIAAIVEWIKGLPGRIVGGITGPAAPGSAQPNPPNPMGDMGGTGGASPSSFVPPAGGRDVVVKTALVLDGRTIADVVTRHQVNAASGPPLSAGRPDLRRNFVPAEGAVG